MAQIEKEILELENQANDSNNNIDDDVEIELVVDEKEAEEDLISMFLITDFKILKFNNSFLKIPRTLPLEQQ